MISPLGFSGGGLIAVLDSIKRIGKALHNQDGASAECQRLTQNLHALQLIFHCLETLESSDANQSCMDAVQAEANKSLKLLSELLQNVARSEKHLAAGVRKSLESPFRATKKLSRLQADINMEIQKMNSYTATGLEQLISISTDAQTQRENPERTVIPITHSQRTCRTKMGYDVIVSSKSSLSISLDFTTPSLAIPSTPEVSLWQVATIAYLLMAWKRKFLKERSKSEQQNVAVDAKMTTKEDTQILEVFDPRPTSYSYRKCELIGKGSCSKVYRAVKVKSDIQNPALLQCANEVVALKEMLPPSTTDYHKEVFIQEVRVMKTFDHENCIKFHEAIWDVGQEEPWIVMEYADYGDLTDLIFRAKLREDHIAAFCKEIAQGLEYLHSKNIVYRDMKSDNILLFSDGAVKIADFGFCEQGSAPFNRIIGTPYWMAPEVCKGLPYDFKVDTWGLGITTMEMMEGQPPNLDESPIDALKLIAENGTPSLKDPAKWSKELKTFLSICLTVSVPSRATMTEVLAHDFLKGVCSRKELRDLICEGKRIRDNSRPEVTVDSFEEVH